MLYRILRERRNTFHTSLNSIASYLFLVMLLFSVDNIWANSINSNGETSINTLACNDLVQISLDTQCQVLVTIDMVTEGDTVLACWKLEVYDVNGDVIPNNVLTSEHLNTRLNLAVIDTCINNSCWGQLYVEDKYIPELECSNDTIRCTDDLSPDSLGFPVPGHLVVRPNGVDNYFISNWDSCGDIILYYDDLVLNGFDCDFAYKTIVRSWHMSDESGNERWCNDTIRIELPNLIQDTIDLKSVTLWCDGNWPTDKDGHPSPSHTGWPIPKDCSTLAATYTDQIIEVCGATQKVLRKWKLVDWCTHPGQINEGLPKLVIYYQIIKILDDKAPLLYCPTTSAVRDTIGMDYYKCSASYTLPIPENIPTNKIPDPNKVYIIAECSSWEYRVRYVPASSPDDCTADGSYGTILGDWRKPSDPAFKITDLPRGCNWFYYEVVDACGNSTECNFDIVVVDDLAPTAVCDHHTSLTLNFEGDGKIFASTFDDGSFDNCGIDTMLVRRMDRGAPCGWSNHLFEGFVEFCCEDAGDTVMVEFKVIDKFGNFAICMVEVLVNDKEKPELKAPTNLIVDCRFVYDIDHLGDYFGKIANGKADRQSIYIKNDPHYSRKNNWLAGQDGYAYDNCAIDTLIETYTKDLHCGRGTITRTFTVRDQGGLECVATQVITFDDVDPFDEDDIHWPGDVLSRPFVTNCIQGINTNPSTRSRVDSAYGFRNLDCANVTVIYKDDTLVGIQDACYKIERTWTVVDWCQFRGQGDPIWEHKQYIKVSNNNAPKFDAGVCDDKVICDTTAYLRNDICVGFVSLKPTATDDCTPDIQLNWSYKLDLHDKGTYATKVNSDNASGRYEIGVHRIKWSVSDACGNVAECDYTFEVKECKAPTPYCRNGLVTVVMPTTGSIAVWAKDLNIGSFDNCTADEDLIFSFTADGKTQSITYNCDSLNDQPVLEREVKMWVIDEAGNKDFCITKVRIQNNGACGGNLTGSVSGLIMNMHDDLIEGSELEIMEMRSGTQDQVILTDGEYAFNGLALFQNYGIKAKNRHAYAQGVTTRDLVAIQKHLLGIKEFEHAWQYAAADANNSESVSASDISALRKIILGRIIELPKQDSWLLYNDLVDMEDAESMKDNLNQGVILDLAGDVENYNFQGIKVGDVDGTINSTNANIVKTRSGAVEIEGEFVTISDQQILIIRAGEEMGLEGLQFTLDFDAKNLNVQNVQSAKLTMQKVNYAVFNNAITVAWNEEELVSVNKGDELFRITFNDDKSMYVELTSRITEAIAALSGAEDSEIVFSLRSNGELTYELWQNRPNPFNESTLISYQLPTAQDAKITFKDMTGRVLKVVSMKGQKGYNEMNITGVELNTTGVIYYQLETATFSSTKKMLMLD